MHDGRRAMHVTCGGRSAMYVTFSIVALPCMLHAVVVYYMTCSIVSWLTLCMLHVVVSLLYMLHAV
jgi:hypothetical protein